MKLEICPQCGWSTIMEYHICHKTHGLKRDIDEIDDHHEDCSYGQPDYEDDFINECGCPDDWFDIDTK